MNPERDMWIIAARNAVLRAKEALGNTPSPANAINLAVQERNWRSMKKLTLVPKDTEDDGKHN